MSDQVTLRDHWGNLAVTVSCKAIVLQDGKVWLRKNERNDWELPGGRLDEYEQPEEAVIREVREELGFATTPPQLVDVYIWKKDFGTTTHVQLVTFSCEYREVIGEMEVQSEAGLSEFSMFAIDEALSLEILPLPYKRALQKYAQDNRS